MASWQRYGVIFNRLIYFVFTLNCGLLIKGWLAFFGIWLPASGLIYINFAAGGGP